MYEIVEKMGNIPIKTDKSGTVFLRDIAKPKDAAMIQTNIVRVKGKREVFIPVYRQQGASTLSVVKAVKNNRLDMQNRITSVPGGVNLDVVMDQSVYVKSSIWSLGQEGVLGAFLCSMVILLFLGQWRMTLIAVMTIPVAVCGAIACLYGLGQTINVMTLAGLALAVGPLVDSAIICLENTERHLGLGAKPHVAAYLGASEVAMPELVASLCTLLVLLPLALMPGLGPFLFRPMFFAVAFAMSIAYVLSRTFVPTRCAAWLRGHSHHSGPVESVTYDWEHRNPSPPRQWRISILFAKWEKILEAGIRKYSQALDRALQMRGYIIGGALTVLLLVMLVFGLNLRREFFPEVDSGGLRYFCPLSGWISHRGDGRLRGSRGEIRRQNHRRRPGEDDRRRPQDHHQ